MAHIRPRVEPGELVGLRQPLFEMPEIGTTGKLGISRISELTALGGAHGDHGISRLDLHGLLHDQIVLLIIGPSALHRPKEESPDQTGDVNAPERSAGVQKGGGSAW